MEVKIEKVKDHTILVYLEDDHGIVLRSKSITWDKVKPTPEEIFKEIIIIMSTEIGSDIDLAQDIMRKINVKASIDGRTIV